MPESMMNCICCWLCIASLRCTHMGGCRCLTALQSRPSIAVSRRGFEHPSLRRSSSSGGWLVCVGIELQCLTPLSIRCCALCSMAALALAICQINLPLYFDCFVTSARTLGGLGEAQHHIECVCTLHAACNVKSVRRLAPLLCASAASG